MQRHHAVAVIVLVAATSAACGGVNDSTASAESTSASAAASSAEAAKAAEAARPSFREVTVPSGTELRLRLTTAVASDTSRVEDAVNADLASAVVVDGRDVVPAGSPVSGFVRAVDQSGRVKGRAELAVGFNKIRVGGMSYDVETSGFSRVAEATKSEDATKIGVGAGVGAVVGGILGGKKGAAEGAAIGGGAGTGVVLATRGKEIRLPSGTVVTTRLTAPLTLRIAG